MREHHTCPHSHPRPRYFVCLLERSSPRQEIRTGSVFCSVGFVGKGTVVHTATKSGTDTNPKGVDTRSRSEGRSLVLLQKQVRKNREYMFEQKPCPIKFSCRCKSYPVKRKQSLNFIVVQTTPRECTKKR